MTELRLDGQVSLVTGAGRGIGKATAAALATAGSAVVLGARTLDQVQAVAGEINAAGGTALAAHLDVTQEVSVRQFVARAMDRFGRIDLLVNNAGSNNGGSGGALGPLWEINPDAWWRDIETNFRGTFLCAHHALSPMIAAGRGRIINVVSKAAAMAWPFNSAYACAKAASIRLTDSLAAEARDQGVFVFCLAPGSVETDIWATSVHSEAGRQWLPEMTPSWVPPQLAAQKIIFLASGAADGLTGRYFSVEHDLAELAAQASDIASRDVHQLRLVY